MVNLNLLQDIILITIGAVFGVNSRFLIYQKLKEININGKFSIFLINIISCFFLGFFISISSNIKSLNVSSQLALFFVIGFIGSLSTFSTFIIEVLESLFERNWIRSFSMITYSLFISFTVGFIGLKIAST